MCALPPIADIRDLRQQPDQLVWGHRPARVKRAVCLSSSGAFAIAWGVFPDELLNHERNDKVILHD
jgi:hypothetical protein